MAELLKTGIPGLDNILHGGFRRNLGILITGSPGTFKTIMALQFICNGAKEYHENGIFITTEESLEDIRYYANTLGMKIEELEKNGSILLIEKSVSMLKGGIVSIDGLLKVIKEKKIRRVAMDSVIFFRYLYPKTDHDETEFRRQVLMFIHQLKSAGVTFLTISERTITDLDMLEYDVLDFVFDAFIMTTRVRKGAYFERIISVIKVRGQEHSTDVYPMTIGEGGVKVLTDQTPFSLVEKEEAKKSN